MTKYIKKHRLSIRLIDISVGVVACGLILFGIWHLTHSASSANLCSKVGAKHTVIYKNDNFLPETLNIHRCDVVSIVNSSQEYVEPIFGTHEHHVTYAGYQHQAIGPNEYIDIDAVQSGSFVVHDHIKDKARLQLTIK